MIGWVVAAVLIAAFGVLAHRFVAVRSRLTAWTRRLSRSREVCAVCLHTEIDGAHFDPEIGEARWTAANLPRAHHYEPARVVSLFGDSFARR